MHIYVIPDKDIGIANLDDKSSSHPPINPCIEVMLMYLTGKIRLGVLFEYITERCQSCHVPFD